MRIPRIFTCHALSCGTDIELDPQATHHIYHVLRLKKDSPLTLFNGKGGEYLGNLIEIHKGRTLVHILSHNTVDHDSSLHITLAQCISKGTRMDYAIQKSTELGVNCIVPLFSHHNAVKFDTVRLKKKHQHWKKISIHACEQSGRNLIPMIENPRHFSDWIETIAGNNRLLFDPNTDTTLSASLDNPSRLVLLIGPEGGLSKEEMALAYHHGFTGVKLGPRILRTETACVTALSIIQSLWGDLN